MDDRDVKRLGDHLESLKIDFIVCGGIASVESVRVIRELRRYGAEVRVVMTKNALQFVQPLVFEWASKNLVVTELTGSAEHLTEADAVVVAPATLDFISRISLGLADSAASTRVQSLLGRKPVIFCPSMHESLSENPLFKKNLSELKKVHLTTFFDPEKDEGKAKLGDPVIIGARICHTLSKGSLKNKAITLSAGATRSSLDDMRFISNRSSGALGVAIANELYRKGADVHLIAGPIEVSIPPYVHTERVETADQMSKAFKNSVKKNKSKAAIFCAAVLDFEAGKKLSGKKVANNNWMIELKPSAKLIDRVSSKNLFKVGFKLESNLTVKHLQSRVREWNKKKQCGVVVSNRLEDVKPGKHIAHLFDAKKNSFTEVSGKLEIARELSKILEANI